MARFPPKIAVKKTSIFWPKPWTNPFANFRVFHMRKRAFFWQKPRTNPFANFRFFTLYPNFKKAFFSIQNIKKRSLVARFPKKTHERKRSIFCQKPWTNPFQNFRFFWTCFILYYSGLKIIRFLGLFWQNPWTNPFANFWFVGLFLNFTIQNITKRSFEARFPTKTYMRKRAIFWKKAMD